MKSIASWIALLSGIAALVFFGLLPPIVERSMNQVTGPQPAQVSARAAALHKTIQIADMHADTLMWRRDLLARGERGQVDLPRLTDGHVALQILSSVTKTPKGQNYDANGADTDNITLLAIAQGQPMRTWHSLIERSLWHAQKLRWFEARSRGALRIVRSKADLARLLADLDSLDLSFRELAENFVAQRVEPAAKAGHCLDHQIEARGQLLEHRAQLDKTLVSHAAPRQ